jgi:aspartate 1-decarboxylase
MQRVMLKSKIHRVRVTGADLEYEGSLTVDRDLLAAADILEFEQVQIYNVSNGARFATYAIAGKAGSGEICLNGAAARLGARGDVLIVASYATMSEKEARSHEPKIVLVGEGNRMAWDAPHHAACGP